MIAYFYNETHDTVSRAIVKPWVVDGMWYMSGKQAYRVTGELCPERCCCQGLNNNAYFTRQFRFTKLRWNIGKLDETEKQILELGVRIRLSAFKGIMWKVTSNKYAPWSSVWVLSPVGVKITTIYK
jgi:hypothetical protein